MPPHRSSRVRHFKISDDILITILELCDPVSVYRAAKSFSRISALVGRIHSLLYKYELAKSGMQDGPVSYTAVAPRNRQPLLLTYRRDWPQMSFSHELKVKIPTPARVGVSGSFLHQIRTVGHNTSLELSEFPSMRLGLTPDQTRHRKWNSPSRVDNMTIDEAQSLIVLGQVYSHGEAVFVELQFKDLGKLNDHKKAIVGRYSTQLGAPISNMSILICGAKVAVSFDFSRGNIRHLLFNWRNSQVKWYDDQDIQFLNEYYMLGSRESHGVPRIVMYNITKVDKPTVVAEFELPHTWAGCFIGFAQNSSPRVDSPANPRALFYQDPMNRVVAITCRPRYTTVNSTATAAQWLFVKEIMFRPPGRREPSTVPWNYWSHKCVLRTQPSGLKFGPVMAGNRALYVCHDHGQNAGAHGTKVSRLNIVDFNQDGAHPSKSWMWVGPQSGLVPGEIARSWQDEGLVEALFATEDNIVLINEVSAHGFRPVKVLTFGH